MIVGKLMGFPAPVIPVELFPGDWCLNCVDPHHPNANCHMLEMHQQEDGSVDIKTCGCDNSVTPGVPGRYIIRVTQVQKE